MRVTILGSGSSGNSTLVEAGDSRLLVDAGFSGRDLERRLRSAGVRPESLSGILVTHDHGDHTRGIGVLARRFGMPLYITPATRQACRRLLRGKEEVRDYVSSRTLRIGDLEVHPFLTAHDAADPIAVTITDAVTGDKLGIATDLGRPTMAVRQALAGSHFLLLEANHDEAMLWRGPYPWSVKQRIASSHGHLSNRASAQLIRELAHPGLAGVVLGHLSEHCNEPDLARDVVGGTLRTVGYAGLLAVARQDHPLAAVDVTRLRRESGPVQLELL